MSFGKLIWKHCRTGMQAAMRVRMPCEVEGQGDTFRGADSLLARMHVQEVARNHRNLLAKHRHPHYMWFPTLMRL